MGRIAEKATPEMMKGMNEGMAQQPPPEMNN
jgi:hypothetical protein